MISRVSTTVALLQTLLINELSSIPRGQGGQDHCVSMVLAAMGNLPRNDRIWIRSVERNKTQGWIYLRKATCMTFQIHLGPFLRFCSWLQVPSSPVQTKKS